MTPVNRLLTAACLVACLFAAPLRPASADMFKTSFGPTTTDISTGHAGQSSIPATLGFFRDENLDVNLFGVAGSAQGVQLLAAGKIDFISLVVDDLLIARAKGVPIRAVYVHSRHPIARFVAPKAGGITALAQLKGKTVGIPYIQNNGYNVDMFAEAGLDWRKDIQLVATGTGGPALLALKRGDIQAWASWDTAVAALENRGMEFTEFRPSYYANLLGNAIVTRDDMIEQHPEVVIGICRAVAKSIEFGLANPEAAIRMHWKAYPETRPQGEDEATAMRDAKRIFMSRWEGYALPPGALYGSSRPEQWQVSAELLKKSGEVPAGFDPSTAYTDQFIDKINQFDRAPIDAQARDWKE